MFKLFDIGILLDFRNFGKSKFCFLLSGLNNLTNEKKGDYYGAASCWSSNKKLRLGHSLLFRAFQMYLLEGEEPFVEASKLPKSES